TLLGYPEESAGRRMSPEVAWIPESFSVGAALARLRETGAGAETIYMVPVVGPGRLLRGVVSLRGLLVASDDAPVAELMSRPVFVRAEEDRELAARRIRDHGMIGLPVVDNEERLVGVITVDDAMRILAEEEDEDAARAGGTDPLRRPYLATSIPRLVRSRVVWLLILIGAATLTVNVLDLFEDALAQVVTLALFIPLLIGTGGNAGAQTVSTVIRALSTGDVDVRDVPRVVGREFLTGLALGGVLGGGAGLLAGVVFGSSIGLVLGLSLVAVCALATTVGALVPLASSRIGVDPAVVSAPFITTIVDATGLIVYFLIARAVLGI
ncbi:MAG: magnesium transporter, partial [Propionibacteriaceae bacterium]|nr:magnesium transporter [Propionibacteriaceae bacterium]